MYINTHWRYIMEYHGDEDEVEFTREELDEIEWQQADEDNDRAWCEERE